MSLKNIINGSTFISATVKGTPGVSYTVSNGERSIDNLFHDDSVYFDELNPSTSYVLDIKRDYIFIKRILVIGTKQPLSIAELRAWTWDGNLVKNNGSATQSSTAYKGVASRALDLKNKMKFADGSVTHTNGGNNNWWKWELSNPLPITKITLWGRSDCCQTRINGSILRAFDTDGNIVAQRSLGTTNNGQILTVQV